MHNLELLKWYIGSGCLADQQFEIEDGRTVRFQAVYPGPNGGNDTSVCSFRAEVVFGDVCVIGDILVVCNTSVFQQIDYSVRSLTDNALIVLTLSNDSVVCRTNGAVIPVIELKPQPELNERFATLIGGADSFGCGRFIASMADVNRVNIFTKLLIERLEDKCNAMDDILDSTDYNWIETFYIMLMRMIGMGSNQQSYIRLAKRVPYKLICREKSSLLSVEALLLGAAGFLSSPIDEYSVKLAREFEHLQYKYGIRPMSRLDWHFHSGYGTRPNSHPVVRLAQIAALLCSKDFMFDKAMNCRSVEDIERLFAIKASEYWNTHYTFGVVTREKIKSISTDTFGVLGINVVCVAMFRYGKYIQNEEMQDAAIDLLECIDAERNSIIAGWSKQGVVVENAYFSQALLQLSKIYCAKKRCGSCFVGKVRMKSE